MSDDLDLSFNDDLDKSEVLCPECDDPMVLRTNRMDGSQFWGCSNYPACKKTLPLDFDEPDEERSYVTRNIPWGAWETDSIGESEAERINGDDAEMRYDADMRDIFCPED